MITALVMKELSKQIFQKDDIIIQEALVSK